MNITEYLPANEDFRAVAQAEELRAAKSLLKAATIRRDKELKQINDHPKRSDDDLTQDVIYKLGMVRALNWIIDLPGKASEYLNHLPEGD